MQDDNKREIINRLRSIQGHLKGVERMVEEDQYCMDILAQTRAVERALQKLDGVILRNHLNTCVTTAIQGDSPAERERVIGELMLVFEQSDKL
ncbi:MAG: metal-sensitive transcriptional regulator [Anaerolineae bacterium]|nr:metal-sensitive transcriptional regulator [Anaerolineae bacterium]